MASSETAATPTEQLLWKIVRAATALKSATDHWQQSQRRSASLRRHVQRCCSVASVLHKASTCAAAFGSTAKVIGGVATVVGVVSRVPALTGLGSRLWRAGCVVKLAGMGGRVMWEMWERGFKDTLSAYMSCLGGFLHSVTLLRSALEEIGLLMPAEFVAGRFTPLLMLVCPEEAFPYALHIVKLFLSPDNYSALYDFSTMAMTSLDPVVSVPLNILHELESFHLFSVLDSLPKAAQMASAALHVAKEVVDLADGLKIVQNADFKLIRQLLQKFRSASLSFANSVLEVPCFHQLAVDNVRPQA